MYKIDLSIIIPSLNESENLKLLIPLIKKNINKKFKYEVIIIDGLKKDKKTVAVAMKNKVRYFNRIHTNNYGDAVRLGIKNSLGKYTIFMDGDFSHDPSFILNLYNEKKYDLVVASRYTEGGKTDNIMLLVILSKILNIFYNAVLNLNLKDVSNSFKLYNSKYLKKLKLKCNHFDIIEEIIFKIKIKNKNVTIKEIPYYFKKRKFGKTKRNFFVIIAYLFSIIRLRLANLN